jgi:hypothetical protein
MIQLWSIRLKRFVYFSFKRFKWFFGIKEAPLKSIKVEKVPPILGLPEGMLVIHWQREGKGPEAYQMDELIFDHLLKSAKKQTLSNFPPDVEAAIKTKYAEAV